MAWKARKKDCTDAIKRLNEKLDKYNIELFFVRRRSFVTPFGVDVFDLEGNLMKTLVTGHLQEINMYLGGMEFVCSLSEYECVIA